MNIYKNISILFLVAVFALSSTGLFVVIHECETCGISEIYIDAEHEHKQHHKKVEHETCCLGGVCETSTEKHQSNNDHCCSDDSFYFKITNPYTFSVLKINFDEVILDFVFFTSHINKLKNNFTNSISRIERPPDLSGKQILHKICVLRI